MISHNVSRHTMFILLTAITLCSRAVDAIRYRTVEIADGYIRGQVHKTFIKQVPYFEFKGIPFAKPPVGNLRFKAPEPIDPWKPRTIDAFEFGNACMQDPSQHLNVSEDCLNLNVFVPVSADPTEKLAVIVYVHGGSFLHGSAQHFGPSFLIEQNIILVTFNYRLGAFGFLSLGTREYSGNMGLKDQQLALKWVYNNIEHFDGDNTQITLMGHSAGGISALTHLFNDESRAYFQRIISISGVLLRSYPTGNHKCIFYEIARNLSKSITNDSELIEFVANMPVQQLLNYSLQPFLLKTLLHFPLWGPKLEDKNDVRPIITTDPYKTLKNGFFHNKAIYFTHTNREMLMFESPESLKYTNVQHAIKTFDSIYLPLYSFDLAAIGGIPLKSKPYLQTLLNNVRKYYFENVTSEYETILTYTKMQSDFVLNYYMDKSTQSFLASSTSIYYSRFSVDSTLNVAKQMLNITLPGAAHADDVCYVFWCYSVENLYRYIVATKDTDLNSSISLTTIVHVTKLFANFVKYGNLSINGPGFEQVHRGQLNYLDVTNDGLYEGQSPSGNLIGFVTYFRREAIRLLMKHGDLPKHDEFNMMCEHFKIITEN